VNAASAGLITTALTVTNLLIGFAFQSLIAFALGLGTLADQFQLTWAVVTFGATVFLTLVSSVLVPRMHKGTHQHYTGDRLYLAGWGFLLASAQAVFGICTSGDLGTLLIASAPCHVLAALTASPIAMAYLNNRFAIAAAGNIFNGLGLVAATAVAYAIEINPFSLGFALTVGYAVQYLLTAFPMRHTMRSANTESLIGLKTLSALIIFTMLTKLQPLLERVLAESLSIGSTAALGFGQKISQGLLLLGAFGLALTATGSLSKAYAKKDQDLIDSILSRTLVTTVVATLTVMAIFIPVSHIVIRVLFQRGQFTPSDTDEVLTIFLAQTPWIIACALTGVLTSFMYVARQYVNVAICSALGLTATAVASVGLRSVYPDQAVALSSSIGAMSTLLYAYICVWRDPVGKRGLSAAGRFKTLTITAVTMFTTVMVAYFVGRDLLNLELTSTFALLVIPITLSASYFRAGFRGKVKELVDARLD
jgi:putative peptidoglycan lipid II flippase